jgi:hypothetical protein
MQGESMKNAKKGIFSWREFLFFALLVGILLYCFPKYLDNNKIIPVPPEKISHGIREGNIQSARPDRWGGD